MKYGLLGIYAKDVIRQTTSRGNVNFGSKGTTRVVVKPATKDSAAVTRTLIGANAADAEDLHKRKVKSIVSGETEEALLAKGCSYVYETDGIKEIEGGSTAQELNAGGASNDGKTGSKKVGKAS